MRSVVAGRFAPSTIAAYYHPLGARRSAPHNQRMQQTIPSANKFTSGLAPDPRRLCQMQNKEIRMYVILDSNIWISELGLNSSLGAAARYFFRERGATVVLPEVIKLETEKHLRIELTNYVSNLKKNHRQLLSVFGKLKELVVPDSEAINAKIASIFGECQVEVYEIPLSLESARSSFLKTIEKVPPSDKNQQFKDGVIWAECLRLLDSADVYLVTADKAFYKDRQYHKGLSESLITEAKDSNHTVYIFPALSDLLETIKSEVKLDEKSLAKLIFYSA